MVIYRLFLTQAGRRTEGLTLNCDNDEAARLSALNLDDGRDMELWQGGRLVEAIRPEIGAAPEAVHGGGSRSWSTRPS